jgi:hypothetical protein
LNDPADLEEDWRHDGKEIFPILRVKYPQAYFQGIVSLARIVRWDVDPTDAFDRVLSPGPEGRNWATYWRRRLSW